jgi:ferrous-iron efflux pump FieF
MTVAAHKDSMIWATRASVAMALVLLGLKLWAWAQSGSVAMLGSLADTSLDLLASITTLLAVRIALTPADREHRFGHGKAEALAGLFQSALILGSSVLLIVQSVRRLMDPQPVGEAELGIGVSLFAIAATLALVAYQRQVVKKTGSLAVETDRLHYVGDLLLNLAVIAALALESYAGLLGADGVFGLGIALSIGWAAYQAARRSIDMLMDREWTADDRRRLAAIVKQHAHVRGVHELRTRTSGLTQFAQFHIWVDPNMTVAQAHGVIDDLERALREAFPQTETLIHVDPEGHVDTSER